MGNKGFRKIENDIFKALIAAGLSGAGYQVVLAIIDRTLGFRKGSGYKEKATIPLAYFEQETGLSHQSVRLAIKQAEQRRIILKERNSTRTSIYALNLDTGEWLTRQLNHPSKLGNKIVLERETKSPQTRKLAVPNCMPAKETLKETIKEIGHDKQKVTLLREDTGATDLCSCRGPSGEPQAIGGLASLADQETNMNPPVVNIGDAIEVFIRTHGNSASRDIAKVLGLPWPAVNKILLTDPRFKTTGRYIYDLAEKANTPITAEGSPAVKSQDDSSESHPGASGKVLPFPPNIMRTMKERLAKQNIEAGVT